MAPTCITEIGKVVKGWERRYLATVDVHYARARILGDFEITFFVVLLLRDFYLATYPRSVVPEMITRAAINCKIVCDLPLYIIYSTTALVSTALYVRLAVLFVIL